MAKFCHLLRNWGKKFLVEIQLIFQYQENEKKILMLVVINYYSNYYNDCQFTYKWHGTQLLDTNCVSKCIGKTTHSCMSGTNYIAIGVTNYHTTNQGHMG